MNLYNLYYLALGNEGSYPLGKDGLTKYAKNLMLSSKKINNRL